MVSEGGEVPFKPLPPPISSLPLGQVQPPGAGAGLPAQLAHAQVSGLQRLG